MSTYSISLTGHRPNKLGNIYDPMDQSFQSLKAKLFDVIGAKAKHYDTVICHSDMALGADMIWATVIIEAKERFGNKVQFTADIPCKGQSSIWKDKRSINQYNTLVKLADKKIVYADKYTPS